MPRRSNIFFITLLVLILLHSVPTQGAQDPSKDTSQTSTAAQDTTHQALISNKADFQDSPFAPLQWIENHPAMTHTQLPEAT